MSTKIVAMLFLKTMVKQFGAVQIEPSVNSRVYFARLSGQSCASPGRRSFDSMMSLALCPSSVSSSSVLMYYSYIVGVIKVKPLSLAWLRLYLSHRVSFVIIPRCELGTSVTND